jgi:DNA-binding response OmpR family regulator
VAVAKVLIADDNEQIRMLVKAALRNCSCEIVEATDGEAALEAALRERPDLVLLDVMMPGLDGFEVLHFLRRREESADTRVIMLTTATATADRERGEIEGADAYVVKPFEAAHLREVVGRYIG